MLGIASEAFRQVHEHTVLSYSTLYEVHSAHSSFAAADKRQVRVICTSPPRGPSLNTFRPTLFRIHGPVYQSRHATWEVGDSGETMAANRWPLRCWPCLLDPDFFLQYACSVPAIWLFSGEGQAIGWLPSCWNHLRNQMQKVTTADFIQMRQVEYILYFPASLLSSSGVLRLFPTFPRLQDRESGRIDGAGATCAHSYILSAALSLVLSVLHFIFTHPFA